MNKPLFLITALLLALCPAGCSAPAQEAVSTPTVRVAPTRADGVETVQVRPGEEWPTSPPEQQGLDPDRLARMVESIEAQMLDLHSLLIVRNGQIVFETYYPPYAQGTRHELFSVTKSFIATLVGIAAEQGAIPDLERTVVSYFPGQEFAQMDPRKSRMTVKHLLTMTSGLDWQEGDHTYQEMYYSPDWVKYVLDIPMLADPGTKFEYCSGCSHLLSAILQEATGMSPRAFAEKHLFGPLGITDFTWNTDAKGIPIGGWGLNITPRDMARLGYLYLKGGAWNGQQIVPEGWVRASGSKQVETDGELDYGYQWWIYPTHGAYAALGRAGQMILVVPDLDLVVVTTANMADHEPIFKLVDEYILPAVDLR
jgi:CubicO group peptidase (beta-lactamase class C family)